MKEFIPLEDDWSLIESFFNQHLVPYQPGMPCVHQATGTMWCEGSAAGMSGKKISAPPSQPSGAAL